MLLARLLTYASEVEYAYTVRLDRVWAYSEIIYHFSPYQEAIHYLRFDEPVEIDGRDYYRLTQFKTKVYSYEFNEIGTKINISLTEDRPEEITKCYLSEAEGLIYQLGYEGKLVEDVSESEMCNNYEHCLIYDWNLVTGDYWTNTPFNQPWSMFQTDDELCVINVLDSIIIEEETCKVYSLPKLCNSDFYDDGLVFIQGIGPTFNGWLGKVVPRLASGIIYGLYRLSYVMDADGNEIYGDSEFFNLDVGINEITDISEYKNQNMLYDIFGRQISNPIKGSLYISGNRKLIAK